MISPTFGDAARFFAMRRDGADIRAELDRATREMSTGRIADTGAATGGRYGDLSSITRGLTLNRSFADGLAIAATQASARQAALERIGGTIDGVAPRLLGLASGGSLSDMARAVADAGQRFESVVSAINTRVAGVSIFAADRTDQTPVSSAEAMLGALRPLVSGAATAADVVTVVETWFLDPSGGFETTAWQGGTGQAAPVILGEGDSTDAVITALDPALREVLTGLALATLASEGVGPGDPANRRALVTAASERMLSATDTLTGTRATLGTAEARIEQAQVRNEAARATLLLEEARILGADPYETATRVQSLEAQLDLHYVLTARLSRLTLTDYLR